MAVSSLTAYLQIAANWTLIQNAPASGLNLPNVQSAGQVAKKVNYITGGNIARGANEFCLFFTTMSAGSAATINLQALTDVLQYTGIVLLRIKGFFFWLLSPTDDATNGTNASSVTIGNAGANPNALDLGGVTQTRSLFNGDATAYESGAAAGLAVSGGALNVKIQNNDGGNSACVLTGIFGATT